MPRSAGDFRPLAIPNGNVRPSRLGEEDVIEHLANVSRDVLVRAQENGQEIAAADDADQRGMLVDDRQQLTWRVLVRHRHCAGDPANGSSRCQFIEGSGPAPRSGAFQRMSGTSLS
jgi:hypothetical protein